MGPTRAGSGLPHVVIGEVERSSRASPADRARCRLAQEEPRRLSHGHAGSGPSEGTEGTIQCPGCFSCRSAGSVPSRLWQSWRFRWPHVRRVRSPQRRRRRRIRLRSPRRGLPPSRRPSRPRRRPKHRRTQRRLRLRRHRPPRPQPRQFRPRPRRPCWLHRPRHRHLRQPRPSRPDPRPSSRRLLRVPSRRRPTAPGTTAASWAGRPSGPASMA